jgi:tetratricopeptide (TPR) repeat protein
MLGDIANWQTKPALAEERLRKSLALCREIGDPHGAAKSLLGLADLKSTQFGDFAATVELAREGLALCRQLRQPDLVARALHALAWPTSCFGTYRESEAYWQESLAICQKIGNQQGVAISLDCLGWVAYCLGGSGLGQASDHYQKALAIFRQIGDRKNISAVLGDLALATGDAGNYELAILYGREGLAVAKEINDIHFIIHNLFVLVVVTCSLGDLQASRTYLTEALQLGWESQKVSGEPRILFGFARLLMKESDMAASHEQVANQKRAKAIELLVVVTNHPATWQLYRDKAAFLLAELEAELPPEVVTTAKARAKSQTLDEVIAEILQAAQ